MGAVLVVEDDPMVVASLCRALGKHAVVMSATTAAAALDALHSSEQVRAAIVDLGLPDGSGLDLARAIRAEYRELPIVIMSGHLTHDLVNRAFSLRSYYVVKPLSPTDMQCLVGWIGELGDIAPAALAERFALTPRESELLALSLGGYRRDVIRARLGIRESTVKKTVARLLRKFDATSLREIAEVIESDEIDR